MSRGALSTGTTAGVKSFLHETGYTIVMITTDASSFWVLSSENARMARDARRNARRLFTGPTAPAQSPTRRILTFSIGRIESSHGGAVPWRMEKA